MNDGGSNGCHWDNGCRYADWVGDGAVRNAVGDCDPLALGSNVSLASEAEGGLSWAVGDIGSNGLGGEC